MNEIHNKIYIMYFDSELFSEKFSEINQFFKINSSAINQQIKMYRLKVSYESFK